MATQIMRQARVTTGKSVVAGAIAGLGGGVVFGMLMGMMGMLPMIGMLIKQDSAIAGLGVHFVISAFIGAVYGAVIGRMTLTRITTAIAGMVNGVFWWVLGALILMPLLLGMNQMVLVIQTAQLMSLMGHLLYGLVTAFLFVPLSQRL
jgi:hypothetical protein